MYGYVYLTRCDVDDTIYIGHRKWGVQYTDEEYEVVDKNEKEWFQQNLNTKAFPVDKEYLGSGRLLIEAVKKYGESHFHLSVLDVANSRDELVSKESYWIIHYYDLGCKMYNLVSTGNTGFDSEMMEESHREEYIAKLKNRAIEQNFVSRFGDVSGENNGRYGKPVSNVTRLRISKANTGRIQSQEEKESRRRSHMEKCPDNQPPCRPGVVYVNNGVKHKQLWPNEVEEFLSNNPKWVRGRIKWHKQSTK